MYINIIGTGKLGTSLAHLFHQQQDIHIAGLFDLDEQRCLNAKNLIGSGMICSRLSELPKADLTMISVGDDQIQAVAQQLYQETKLQPGHIIFHCSGLLSSDILKHPNYPDVYCASIHPLKSFASHQISLSDFDGTFCAMEGDTNATIILASIYKKIGAKLFSLDSTQKNIYHAGCVFASNYLLTMAEQALQCFKQAGIDFDMSKNSIIKLMQGTLNNLKNSTTPSDVLTGPIQRADIQTLQTHLSSLGPSQQRVYALIGLSTLEFCKHEPEILNQLKNLLNKYI